MSSAQGRRKLWWGSKYKCRPSRLPKEEIFKITLEKAPKNSPPKKRNSDQKINDSKPHIWKLLISDFQVESLKPNKN